MKKIFVKENNFYFVPLAIFIVLAGLVLILFNKIEIHLFINSFHSVVFDYFFAYITHLGDGFTFIILVIVMLFVSLKKTVIIASAGLLEMLIVYVIKQCIDAHRPFLYFWENGYGTKILYLVENPLVHYSFPSGHTTTAFSVFLFIALHIRSKYLKLLCFVLAFLVGYSRMYLSQHFLIDVFAGALLGTAITVICYLTFEKFWRIRDYKIFRKIF